MLSIKENQVLMQRINLLMLIEKSHLTVVREGLKLWKELSMNGRVNTRRVLGLWNRGMTKQ